MRGRIDRGGPRKVLVTGATGFVGRHLVPALEMAGISVRCGTRFPFEAQLRDPSREWVLCDVHSSATLGPALAGCDAAFYLVHGMRHGRAYRADDVEGARRFRSAAEIEGLSRLVYLGGVEPRGRGSKHLRSRLETGRVLRDGLVPVVELRAAMIVGAGGASWTLVRDLGARMPVLAVPQWLASSSCPVAIDDACVALTFAIRPAVPPGVYDLPGADCLSHRQQLARAGAMASVVPRVVLPLPGAVPPRVAGWWAALVTRVELRMVHELVAGLTSDLLPRGESIWRYVDHAPSSFEQAVKNALDDEKKPEQPSAAALNRIGHALRATNRRDAA